MTARWRLALVRLSTARPGATVALALVLAAALAVLPATAEVSARTGRGRRAR